MDNVSRAFPWGSEAIASGGSEGYEPTPKAGQTGEGNLDGSAQGLHCPAASGLTVPSYQVVQQSILGLWDVVNQLTMLQPPPHDRYHVTIFGSARIERDTDLYRASRAPRAAWSRGRRPGRRCASRAKGCPVRGAPGLPPGPR